MFDERKFFICFRVDGVTGVYVKNWHDDEHDYVEWFAPTTLDIMNMFKKSTITTLKRGDFPKVDNLSDGFTIVLDNYDSYGNFRVDTNNPVIMENRTLRSTLMSLERALKQFENVTNMMSKDQEEVFLRTMKMIEKTNQSLRPNRQDYEDYQS